MSGLPKGWIELTLTDVVKDITGGGTPSKSQKEYFKGTIPFMTVKDMKVNRPDDTIDKITQSAIDNSSANLIDANTLIISTRMGLGKIVKVDFACAINQDLKALYLEDVINIDYFEYQYRSLTSLLESLGKGTTVKGIRLEVLKSIKILVAPLNEQIRIANKLYSILAKVDKAQARLDKIPAILKRFRQSVLAAATSGELTKEWREELGIEWFTRCLTVEQIAKKEKYSLGIGPFGSNLKVADYRSEGHPLVFVREIRARQFGGADTKFVDHGKFTELAAHRAKPGNILITKMGDPPGDVAIYPDDCAEAVITSDCIKLDVNEKLISKKFVFYYMQSEHFQSQMRAITAGVAQQKVNLKNFKGLTLLAPSMEEQIEINRKISRLMDRADTVEKQYREAKDRLDRLTQSILAKAFRGELVMQDPNDEPAEKLLERILAEKEQSEPKKTTLKRTTNAKTAEKE
ncbi:restriction endonuclease subunit S [Vibrio fluvialis]|nr:restriction endonuclease subunit S [Vibrio fluvialis]MBY8220971.1 restriction endonuclease subunit S [Vibrio fluvialis]